MTNNKNKSLNQKDLFLNKGNTFSKSFLLLLRLTFFKKSIFKHIGLWCAE